MNNNACLLLGPRTDPNKDGHHDCASSTLNLMKYVAQSAAILSWWLKSGHLKSESIWGEEP